MNALLWASINSIKIYEALGLALGNAVLLFFASFKFVQTLQQTAYDGKGFMKWLKRKDNIYMLRLVVVSILSVFAFLIFNIAIMIFDDSPWIIYFGFAFYVFFFVVYIKQDRSVKNKVPLVKTARVKRLLVTLVLLSFLFGMLYMTTVNLLASLVAEDSLLYKLRYGAICLSPMFLPVVVLISYYVNEPFERHIKRTYVEKCKQALSARPDLIKIAITGSYGKTSVKEILSTILSEKFNVLATPYSFNTPMGICKTVKKLDATHEVFIAEMGARNKGDIAELAEIVEPRYAIMTGVIAQHIETFGSVTRIKKTKYELIEALPSDGFAVFSVDNENSYELMGLCPTRKMGAGIDGKKSPAVYAEDVRISKTGTRFTLCTPLGKVECSTVLIGTHNVSNVCLAAAMAIEVGLELHEIAAGINRIKPIKHRLEIIENQHYVIIDDSFNANVNGTIAAMEVLDCFEGRKIVVTPGLVELGSSEDHENYKLGTRLGSHASIVILVGKRRIDKIKEGLLAVDFPQENIICVKDLNEAKKQLAQIGKDGDVIIFENDLPDKYN